METEFLMTQNGQELQTGDINVMSTTGGLADDRTLAELLRLAPNVGTMAKCIVGYGVDGSVQDTVAPSGTTDAKVVINPFRAVIGSRDTASTNALHAWRDLRSGVFVGGGGSWSTNPPTSLTATQLIAANSSGHARWDLLYAIVTPDVGTNSVPRAVKSASSGVVNSPGTPTYFSTTVSLGYLQGTPATSPALPALPSDSGGVYYIALAYVMVPNLFGASSQVQPWMILSAAPAPIGLSKGLGGANAAPANQLNVSGGQVVQSTSVASWANNSTTTISARPGVFMPPSMVGEESLFGGFDLSGATAANWSHQSLTLVDSSRDWRNRLFRTLWFAGPSSSLSGHFAWDRKGSASAFSPRAYTSGLGVTALAGHYWEGFGQSFIDDSAALPGSPPTTNGVVSYIDHNYLSPFDPTVGGASVALYVDPSSGALKVYINGTSGDSMLFFWLTSTRPFGNY